MQRGWWLEDAVPGTVLRHAGGRTIDDAEHVWLAWITHNVSDVHGNTAAAVKGDWGVPLVLGALTVSVVVGLAGPATGPPASAAASVGEGWQTIRLSGPVVAGDTIYAESVIHAAAPLTPEGSGGHVHRTIHGRNQNGQVVATIEEQRWVPSRHAAEV
jgi:acyl dehydratase